MLDIYVEYVHQIVTPESSVKPFLNYSNYEHLYVLHGQSWDIYLLEW
jgi:hypothetical protein